MKITPNPMHLSVLQCPICKNKMSLREPSCEGGSVSLYCEGIKKHCYDFASSGYVNLMPPGHTKGGDSKQAVVARSSFLNTGYYQPAALALRDLVTEQIRPLDGIVIDAGCGEGYYTTWFAKAGFSVAGIDLSRPAVEASAKRISKEGIDHAFFSVSSVFDLPFADECAAALINVFAPCVEREFLRVLKPGGILAVMYAGPDHLKGLKHVLYDHVTENDTRADLPTTCTLIKEERVRFDILVKGNANVQNLFAMTPYYWRTSPTDSEKLSELEELNTTVDMIIAVYQKSIE